MTSKISEINFIEFGINLPLKLTYSRQKFFFGSPWDFLWNISIVNRTCMKKIVEFTSNLIMINSTIFLCILASQPTRNFVNFYQILSLAPNRPLEIFFLGNGDLTDRCARCSIWLMTLRYDKCNSYISFISFWSQIPLAPRHYI